MKNGMTISARLFLAVLLAGLGGCGLYKWQKPGADDAAFKTDSAACQQVQNPDGYSACMQSRGWTLQ
ncbi:hypothetical protein GCM10011611_63970 [Aliidongia dinghuensis]|uniref:Lipoprotein n=2 Tax=Aliidongia dinghuensis TaxID=1867774 RepID=A0A8J2Z215_9PROT|nr:hypothetical protein GCM10011611_63970 [Aliidongia dinghuensis]